MTELETSIIKIEDQWLDNLFNVVSKLFKKHRLSSHDHVHHLRVWHFAKHLISHLQFETRFSETDIQELIFACFFHDTGLTRTLDIKHGLESYHILEENRHLFPGVNISDVLKEAIIHHDDKEYKTTNKDNPGSVPAILSIADDLDAFGAIGAYRYAEIYLLRNVATDELSSKVIKNLSTRFQNFTYVFSGYRDLIKHHEKRYAKTRMFFEKSSSGLLEKLHYILTIEKQSIYELMNQECLKPDELCTFVTDIKTEWESFAKTIQKHENRI